MTCVTFFGWIGAAILQSSPGMCLPQGYDTARAVREETDHGYVPPERIPSHIVSSHEASANGDATILLPILTKHLRESRPLVNELHKQRLELDFYISNEIPTDSVTQYNVKCQIKRHLAKKPIELWQYEFIDYRYSSTELNMEDTGKKLISYYREKTIKD
ncbi:uncharacterized protein BDW43DRAFT_313607 [Aspergillus alliaceus]|uniref:uncharacterized protein n=1 Tax=Petromyces alliaceus TaxID=209559 RepID=UPI0012A580B6|nr:uncharacterized protein BDW43DRAFT_313607 [Aspergillus alliaceus]KAB8230796.1 hypothetical protein BDW43DRAFT_313607 [Aspergillus alliaceus]